MIDLKSLEQALALELQRKKNENDAKQREMERILAESEEFKRLKNKVQVAKVNKERTKQITETQIRKIEELKTEAALEQNVLQKMLQDKQKEDFIQGQKQSDRLDGVKVMKEQMQEKVMKTQEARQQYLSEKGDVDKAVQKLVEEDKQAALQDQMSKQMNYQVMVETLAQKEERLRREKQRDKIENQKVMQFQQAKDDQNEQLKLRKAEEDRIKQEIWERLRIEKERQEKDKNEYEEMRQVLYQEEQERANRQKDYEEQQKRFIQKQLLQQFEREALEDKVRQREEEQKIERDFIRIMMQKFAEDDKLEQMTNQKRRMKELQHKAEVEKLWELKLDAFRKERDAIAAERRRLREEELYRQEVIRMAKERLHQEMHEIGDFMPKGVAQNEEEMRAIKGQQVQQRQQYQEYFKMK